MKYPPARQYLSIDFLHDDFGEASACADYLIHGGLDYMMARHAGVTGAKRFYRMTRRTLDATPSPRLTLIARAAFPGEKIDPERFRPAMAQISRETRNPALWNFGGKIRVAKLFAYGRNIFEQIDARQLREAQIPVWRDAGLPQKPRIPRHHLGREFFSLNTSRIEPHWIGPVSEWRFDRFIKRCPVAGDATQIELMTITPV